MKKRIASAALASGAAAVTLLVFGPLELYLANMADLKDSFGFGALWPPVALLSLAFVAVATVLLTAAGSKAGGFLTALVFAGALSMYVQGNFLNGSMDRLHGDSMQYAGATPEAMINACIWCVIFFAAGLLFLKKRALWGKICAFGSLLIMGMQLIALAVLLLSTEFSGDGEKYLSTDEMFTLSGEEQNVAVFILDYFDQTYLQEALSGEPGLLDQLDGFTRFNDVVSGYSVTFPSVPYLITGERYYFDYWYGEYMDKAYAESDFLKQLKDAGCSVEVYTDSSLVGSGAAGVVDNLVLQAKPVDYGGMMKGMLKLSLYRYAPQLLKQHFYIYTGDLQNMSVRHEAFYTLDDAQFYENMKSMGMSLREEKSFKFYHLNGAHSPYTLDSQGSRQGETTRQDQIKGVFAMINDYIAMLKKQGIYDSTTIVITADHGVVPHTETLEEAVCPILLVKPKGASGEMAESDIPVSHNALHQWLLNQFTDAPQAAEGLMEEKRSFLYVMEKDAAVTGLQQYDINGDANDFSNWSRTDQVWTNDGNYY